MFVWLPGLSCQSIGFQNCTPLCKAVGYPSGKARDSWSVTALKLKPQSILYCFSKRMHILDFYAQFAIKKRGYYFCGKNAYCTPGRKWRSFQENVTIACSTYACRVHWDYSLPLNMLILPLSQQKNP